MLQEREVDRVGGKDPVNIDIRVLATTNRNLETEAAKLLGISIRTLRNKLHDYSHEGAFEGD